MKIIITVIFIILFNIQHYVLAKEPDGKLFNSMIVTKKTLSSICFQCHGYKGFSVIGGNYNNYFKRSLFINFNKFYDSVHGSLNCALCHSDITQIPHIYHNNEKIYKFTDELDCVMCHERVYGNLFDTQEDIDFTKYKNLKKISKLGILYSSSVHGLPDKNDIYSNARCWDCHNIHYMDKKNTTNYDKNDVFDNCKKCHLKSNDNHSTSIHNVDRYLKLDGALCIDCHKPHIVRKLNSRLEKFRILKKCFGCHKKHYKTHYKTYHGKFNMLKYNRSIKCFYCHKIHGETTSVDLNSKNYIDKRINVCGVCHKQKTDNLLFTYAHSSYLGFNIYSLVSIFIYIYIMISLLLFAFLFLHTIILLYNYTSNHKIYNKTLVQNKYIHIQSVMFFIINLLAWFFIIIFLFNSIALFYSNIFWAKIILKYFININVLDINHKKFSKILIFLFFLYIYYTIYIQLFKNYSKYKFLNINLMYFTPKDFNCFMAIVKWSLGNAPKPEFNNITYWQKLNFWILLLSVFVNIMSGTIIWFPNFFISNFSESLFNHSIMLHKNTAIFIVFFLFTSCVCDLYLNITKTGFTEFIFNGIIPIKNQKIFNRLSYYKQIKTPLFINSIFIFYIPNEFFLFYKWFNVISLIIMILFINFTILGIFIDLS